MEQVSKLLTIDLDRQQIHSEVTIQAKQGDTASRELVITLRQSGVVWEPPGTATARLRLLKPDNTAVYKTAQIEGGKVHIPLEGQMLTKDGLAKADVEISDGDALLSSFLFYIEITERAVPDGTIESDGDFTALQDAIRAVGEISTATNAANAAADRANEAADRVEPDITQLQTDVGELDSMMDAQVALTQTLQQWIAELGQSKMDKSAVADYIVEEGTSGIWTYRKWNSGVAECWGRYRTTISMTSTGVSGINKGTATLTLPSGLFVGAPIVNGGVTQYYHNWCSIAAKDKDNIDVAYFQTNTNGNNAERTFDVQANGRWKS